MNQSKIGAYIAVKRKAQDLTQAQLAQKLGVSDKSVSKWERGVCLPDVSLFQDICGILGISINEFFAGEDIAREAVEEQSEKNILAILKDSVHRNSKLKKTIKSLVAALVLVVVAGGAIIVKNLNDNGYFDKNYVRSFAGTENEKVMNSLFSSLNRNYGVLEYSNDSGSKKVEIIAKEYMRGKFLRSKVCSTMQIRWGEGMIGVLLDSDKGEYMVSVGDSEGVGGMESAVENPVVANENKMTSVGFLQGTAFMEDGPIPIAAYYADAEGDSFSTVPAERILETNGKCLKESGVDYCLIITCEFK